MTDEKRPQPNPQPHPTPQKRDTYSEGVPTRVQPVDKWSRPGDKKG